MSNKVVVGPKSSSSTVLIVISLFSLYYGENFVCIAQGQFFLSLLLLRSLRYHTLGKRNLKYRLSYMYLGAISMVHFVQIAYINA